MHLSIEELSEILGVPTQRINNLLNMAGLMDKITEPSLRWKVNPKGERFYQEGHWSSKVIPLLEDQIDRQEERSSVRITQLDTELCEKCWQEKPYYEFFESNKRRGELTKWCKKCHRRYGGWI